MVGELLALLFIAIAVSLDAFSVSLGVGLLAFRRRQIFKIGLAVGIFHCLMPLAGLFIGQVISMKIGMMATMVGGILLVGLGAHLLLSTFREKENTSLPVGIGLVLFAMSVSVDSFSAGLSLGMFGARAGVTILLFGIVSMMFTWAGLLLGHRVKGAVGIYGELLGGSILLIFGLKLLFSF